MKVRTLKFVAGSDDGVPVVCEDFGQNEVMRIIEENNSDPPALYVVNPDGLAELRRLTRHGYVADLGKQSPPMRRDLFKCFQGCGQIPLIEGKYKSSGRLEQGVTSFLNRVHEIRPGKAGKRPPIYILGTTEAIFNELVIKGKTKDAAAARGGEDDQATLNRILEQMLGECAGVNPEDQERIDELAQVFIGNSIEAQAVRWLALRAAQDDVSVLILGESGTGKEIVANIIHGYSRRGKRQDMLFPLNCAAISPYLFEAILFGQEKIWHDSPARDGILTKANGGTVFLDEIGDLLLDHQTKLLRFLSTGKYLPIGATKERSSDVRIIAATNQDLFRMVLAKEFREDLYYRLLPMLIRTPALRDHAQDIAHLAQHCWRKICQDPSAVLPKDVLSELQMHKWPGNIREMKFILKSMHVMFPGQKLSRKHFRIALQYHYGPQFAPSTTEELLDAGLPWLETIRHLHRVEELVRACKVCVGPLLSASEMSKQTVLAVKGQLGYHLFELERLLESRDLLDNDAMWNLVVQFKERVAELRECLPENERRAGRLWNKETKRAHKKTASMLGKTIERLISGA
ncbi:MAG: sigma 54-interacting transcriptional regulator [Candidatus Alcyoniella australis]|nr:sigma 54-interacting transcriptional regulator [Candidatus Alcyoniella australis]